MEARGRVRHGVCAVVVMVLSCAPSLARAQGSDALTFSTDEIIRGALLIAGVVVELALVLLALGKKRRPIVLVGCVVVGLSVAVGAAVVVQECRAWLAVPDFSYQEEIRPQYVSKLRKAALTVAFGLFGAVLGVSRLRAAAGRQRPDDQRAAQGQQ